MKVCERCEVARPDNEDPIAERAWDILHGAKLTWSEFMTAVNEYAASKDLVRAAIAAACIST